MRANIRATRHMWTYEYTIDYIMGRIANTSNDPGVNEYRRNGTNCTSFTRWVFATFLPCITQSDLDQIQARRVSTGTALTLVLR